MGPMENSEREVSEQNESAGGAEAAETLAAGRNAEGMIEDRVIRQFEVTGVCPHWEGVKEEDRARRAAYGF